MTFSRGSCFAMADRTHALPALTDGTVVTVGTFDGVHRGHHDILRHVVRCGESRSFATLLVTFHPHPVAVLNPDAAPLLLTPGEEQRMALTESGVAHTVVLPFTTALAGYGAADFVALLMERYAMRHLVMGYNHRLGRGREGDASLLTQLGRRMGFEVDVVPPTLGAAGESISSTRIRQSILAGDLSEAANGLGRFYSIHGVVERGAQRGRDLGYPTLNITLTDPRKLLPPDGVYAVRATSIRGAFGGMMNLGGRPTFGDFRRAVEVHLFDVNGDWYSAAVSVDLVRRLRDTTRFSSVEGLVAQLARDADDARVALTQA
jgi:riboflavin kinase/FMN adenylyltransferase